ncbi:hypothetical protein ABGB07_00370 [Micromonosporaceae bacterium B7E4]
MQAAVVALLLPLTAGAAEAEALPSGRSAAESRATIDDVAQRVKSRWGVEIDRAAYQVKDIDGDAWVLPRGADIDVTHETRPDGSRQVSFSMTADSLPAGSGPPAGTGTGAGVRQDGTAWYTPFCAARIGDQHGVGWMDKCTQYGRITYLDSVTTVMKMWASCGALDGGPDFWEVDECYVENRWDPGQAVWADYQPRSTVPLSNCGDIPLSVSSGPFSLGTVIRTCEKLVPTPGAHPPNFKATWIGDSYWGTDVRETGFLIAYRVNNPNAPVRGPGDAWGYVYSECNPPPQIIDQCDWF